MFAYSLWVIIGYFWHISVTEEQGDMYQGYNDNIPPIKVESSPQPVLPEDDEDDAYFYQYNNLEFQEPKPKIGEHMKYVCVNCAKYRLRLSWL